MKKIVAFLPLLLLAVTLCNAQEKKPSITLKWAPAGLILGNVGLQGEYNFGKNSLTAKIGIPIKTDHSFKYDGKDALFFMKATSFLAGYRTYLSKRHMAGLYLEPFFKYVHHSGEGSGYAALSGQNVVMNFTNDYNGIGVGAQLGFQFLIRQKFVIDLFLAGPEINASRNNFKAAEATNTLPWTTLQVSEVEEDVRDFLDQFPFIRRRTMIAVDRENKTVTADFKGALPGWRTGISLGLAF